jgi:hypothetical protein
LNIRASKLVRIGLEYESLDGDFAPTTLNYLDLDVDGYPLKSCTFRAFASPVAQLIRALGALGKLVPA